jgi:pilus assembly protein CpaB
MKNPRALTMMALAVLLGVSAVILASRWLIDQSASGAGRIAVAGTDVSLGHRLTPDAVKLVDWPVESIPQGAFTDPQKLDGRVLRSSILKGEPYTQAKLAPIGTLGGLSAVISEGKRAITVRVNDVIGVAGFALPGNYVDIIVNTKKDGPASAADKGADISKIVLERILVLAVAQEVGRDDTKPRVVNAVTLEVTPEQAENLDLARSVGSLSLALRNQVDPQPAITEGATKLSMLNEKPAAPPKAATVRRMAADLPAGPQKTCIGVINGLGGSQECF